MTSITTPLLLRVAPMAALCVGLTSCETISNSTSTAVSGARVVEVSGSARVADASRKWRPLRAGDAVADGYLIQTASGSAANIVVGGAGTANCRILLQVDSVLAVQSLPNATANELQLDLRAGWLTLSSTGGDQSPRCEISFPNGVVTAHGATFNLASDGRVKVMEGSVVAKSLNDQAARTITAGAQLNPETGAVEPIAGGAALERPAPAPTTSPKKRFSDYPWPKLERPK